MKMVGCDVSLLIGKGTTLMKMVDCDVSLLIERKGDYFDEGGGL